MHEKRFTRDVLVNGLSFIDNNGAAFTYFIYFMSLDNDVPVDVNVCYD